MPSTTGLVNISVDNRQQLCAELLPSSHGHFIDLLVVSASDQS